jgi:hypothetical protein
MDGGPFEFDGSEPSVLRKKDLPEAAPAATGTPSIE